MHHYVTRFFVLLTVVTLAIGCQQQATDEGKQQESGEQAEE